MKKLSGLVYSPLGAMPVLSKLASRQVLNGISVCAATQRISASGASLRNFERTPMPAAEAPIIMCFFFICLFHCFRFLPALSSV